MPKILTLTGIRSEYFLSRPVYQAITEHPELELGVVVAGAHLSPMHNYSGKTVEDDGFTVIERIESLLNTDSPSGRLKGAALQLQVLSHIVDNHRPDWLLAIGDREEAIALAMCGVYLDIPIAHYGAGDRVVGNVDDMVRHAVSRLSHLMFTASEDSRNRLIKAGEQDWRVHYVGHSGVDRIRSAPTMTSSEMASELGIAEMPEQFVVVIYHPLSSEVKNSGNYARIMFEALSEIGLTVFCSYPNSDSGREEIVKMIKNFGGRKFIHAFQNIPDTLFVNLLRRATMMVGNSSAGIMETPFLKLPVINIGNRQKMRTHSQNVFFVDTDKQAIIDQARMIIDDQQTINRFQNCENMFGDGHAGPQIANLIAETPIDKTLLNKDLTY